MTVPVPRRAMGLSIESFTVTFASMEDTLWMTRSFWLPAVIYQEAMELPERLVDCISPSAGKIKLAWNKDEKNLAILLKNQYHSSNKQLARLTKLPLKDVDAMFPLAGTAQNR